MGMSQGELAEKVGLSQVTIQHLESGRNKGTKHILTIARELGVNPTWLEAGKGPISPRGEAVSEQKSIYAEAMQLAHIPVVGDAEAGDNGYWEAPDYPAGHGDGFVNFPTKDQNAYAIRIHGDSMSPRFRHGEFVIIEPNHPPSPGDEVLVKTGTGRAMVKIFLYWRDDRLYLDSINNGAGHGQISIPREDVVKFHLVAGSVKKALYHHQ